MSDRTVHATLTDQREIVRYGRSGKWYVEQAGIPRRPRRHVSLNEAVRLATQPGAVVDLGLSGGKLFDAAVKRSPQR